MELVSFENINIIVVVVVVVVVKVKVKVKVTEHTSLMFVAWLDLEPYASFPFPSRSFFAATAAS